MNQKLNISEIDDMLITPYLSQVSLPQMLADCLTLGRTAEEKDMLLVSLLTAASSTLPHISFLHGHLGKRYYANMQTFIMAGAASGKGIASMALELVRPIHDKYSLILPGDSTYPAFFKALYEQDGIGYMHESEGSVITDIWKGSAMTYNTALRKAAEHEPLSRNRCVDGNTIIPCPRLSCLLTGTFSQFKTLVPSVENGFFSRLTTLVIRNKKDFDATIFCAALAGREAEQRMRLIAGKWFRLYEHLMLRKEDMNFCLTDEQARELGTHFATEHKALLAELGENFHPSVVRMGVTAMRIAAILSAFRMAEQLPATEQKEWICREDDYRTAVLISGKLLLHAADAFLQIEGNQEEAVPAARTSLQKQLLLQLLPEEFTTQEAIKIGTQQGISKRSTERYIAQFKESGTISMIAHGTYNKVA